jgi:hypothetical protein
VLLVLTSSEGTAPAANVALGPRRDKLDRGRIAPRSSHRGEGSKVTIDERIEALTMNLELMSHQQEAQVKRAESFHASIESFRASIEEFHSSIEEIVPIVKDLVRVAEMHERRITRIEGPVA